MPKSKRYMKHPHIKIEYGEERFEVVADSIVKLAAGVQSLNGSGLTHKAIVLLLHDATKVNKRDIEKILEAAPLLAERYVKPEKLEEMAGPLLSPPETSLETSASEIILPPAEEDYIDDDVPF
jgi:hypothetical protein